MATGAVAHLSRPASQGGAVRVGEVVQQAGLVPTILGIGAIYLVVTLGMCFNGRFARWTSASQARHISVVE
jgi:hypothetical protein